MSNSVAAADVRQVMDDEGLDNFAKRPLSRLMPSPVSCSSGMIRFWSRIRLGTGNGSFLSQRLLPCLVTWRPRKLFWLGSVVVQNLHDDGDHVTGSLITG